MSDLRPHGMDLSDDQRFPAVVEIVLGSGHRFRIGTTDDEAGRVITELSEWAARDEDPNA